MNIIEPNIQKTIQDNMPELQYIQEIIQDNIAKLCIQETIQFDIPLINSYNINIKQVELSNIISESLINEVSTDNTLLIIKAMEQLGIENIDIVVLNKAIFLLYY
ncbi:6481_t:CDS:2 [Scutellospora calospora]|uniref:6481_t:CDS:1 n=1 Tax=Scutellospora calospora TaxID=85575 RepID=A0ACA9JUD0_9GLOM|nr:6481_t:CDS:2 [Scutellospora calospora]